MKFVSYAPSTEVFVFPVIAPNNQSVSTDQSTDRKTTDCLMGVMELSGKSRKNGMEGGDFTDVDRAVVIAFNRLVSDAVTRRRRLEVQARRTGRLARLVPALKPISLSLQVPSLLHHLTDITKTVLQAERCTWYVVCTCIHLYSRTYTYVYTHYTCICTYVYTLTRLLTPHAHPINAPK